MRLTDDQYQEFLNRRPRTATKAQLAALKPKRQKFNARKTVVDGKVFASAGEARRWQELELLERAGKIRNLQRQVKYDIVWNGVHICSYTADAVYQERWANSEPHEVSDWVLIVEDFKGGRPREWARTKKLMLACHGIDVREVRG